MFKPILTVLMLLIFPALSYGQPAIHFSEMRYDAGRVGQDDKIEHIFEFINTGNEPLVISKLTPS